MQIPLPICIYFIFYLQDSFEACTYFSLLLASSFLNTFFPCTSTWMNALDTLILKLCQIIILIFKVCFSVDISQPRWSWWIETNDENERKIERWSCLNGTLLFSCCDLCDEFTLLRCWNHARFLYSAKRRAETCTVTLQQSFYKSELCLFTVNT